MPPHPLNSSPIVRHPAGRRFNELLRRPEGAQDAAPLQGWGRVVNGHPRRYVLNTAVAYAQYVLATSNQRSR